MKIIPENEVNEAAEKHCKTDVFLTQVTKNKTWDKTDWGMGNYKGFKAGVTFAESIFQEAFKDIIIENQGLKLYKDNEAKRFEELAIEFAKYLFSTEISKHTSMENSVKYTPPEFSLMKDNLIKNGKELFNQFLKERDDNI